MPEKDKKLELLSGWFKRNNINGILLDLDDTLLNTNDLFDQRMKQFISTVTEKDSRIDWRVAWHEFVKTNNSAFKEMAVQKSKLIYVAGRLDQQFDSAPIFTNHTDILLDIYNKAPNLIDGAIETLDAFAEIGKVMGSVTHAEIPWTNIKVDKYGLGKYFSHVEIVDEKRHKGPGDWQKAADSLGIAPEQILVIGDNLEGDLISAYKTGVKHGIWVKPKWSVYSQGEKPDGVMQIDSIGQVVDTLINL